MSNEKKGILVIGAAHIDVYASPHTPSSDVIDQPGNVFISLGGTAFNISSNLAFDRQKTCLLTAIDPSSLSGFAILAVLDQKKIDKKFLIKNETLSEGAFVAFLQNGELQNAVTQTPIENLPIEDEKLKRAIKNASVIVADCNLSRNSLKRVIKYCNDHKRFILVAGVSQSKTERIKNIPQDLEIDVFSANHHEIMYLLKKDSRFASLFENETWSNEQIIKLCTELRVKHLIITEGQNGYSVLSKKSGNREHFTADVVQNFVSSTGAGDALLAGVACYFETQNRSNTSVDWEPDWSECNRTIQRYMPPVLRVETASPSSSRQADSLLIFAKKIMLRQIDKNPPNYKKLIFVFFAIVVISSIILAFLEKFTFTLMTLLSIVIFSILLIYDFISQKEFLEAISNNKKDE